MLCHGRKNLEEKKEHTHSSSLPDGLEDRGKVYSLDYLSENNSVDR